VQKLAPGALGYCFAFDVATNALTAMQALTAGNGPGSVMAGQGRRGCAGAICNLITGNGDLTVLASG